MGSEQVALTIEQGVDTLTSLGGSADSLAFSTPAADTLSSVAAANDTLFASADSLLAALQAAESLYVVPHAVDTLSMVSITDFLQPFGEPLYPLIAHLIPSASPLAAGHLPDYTVQGDNTMTLILLCCFVMLVVALKRSWNFIVRQAKSFFVDSSTHEGISETSGEMRFQFFLLLINSLLLAIGTFLFISEDKTAAYVLDNDMLLVGILLVMFTAYFIVKLVTYKCVNLVFFGEKKSLQWTRAFLFLTGVEGVLLFPLVLLQVYFNLSFQKVLICFVSLLFLNKILTFYKGWNIFFKENGGFLQTFLYFCTLEIAPLLAFTGVLRIAIEQLKINF